MPNDVDRVYAVMRAQSGAVHHRLALALGMSEGRVATLVRTGAWLRAHPRVYVAAGAAPSFATRCGAAVLAVRHSGRWNERRPVAVAGLAAAWLHDLDVPAPRLVDLVVPFEHPAPDLDGVHVARVRTWSRRSFGVVDGVPVTSLQDTFVDVGMLLPRDRLHALLQEAAFARPRLPLAIAQACRRGRSGSAGARRVAALVGAGVDSSLHARGLALLRAAGVTPECGVELVAGAGPSDCVVRLPVEAPPFGLVVEWDGDAHRVDRQTFLHDREKDRLLRRAGYVTLRYTDEHVRRRAPVVDEVRAERVAALARSVRAARGVCA